MDSALTKKSALLAAVAAFMLPAAMAQSPNCVSLANTKACSQWKAYSFEVQPGSPANLEEFDAYITAHQNNNSISEFQNSYGCPGWQGGSGIRFQTTTYCGLLVFSASAACNPSGVSVTTCRSSVEAFISSTNALFSNTNICSANPNTDQSNARSNLVSAVQRFASSLQQDDPNSGTPPANVCVLANSDVPDEINTCGFYDASAALQFCNANQNNFCCTLVPGFVKSGGGASTTSAAATSASTTVKQQSTVQAPSRSTDPAIAPSSTATSASQNGDGSSSETKIFGLGLPIFIGAVVGGSVVLIAIIVGIILCTRRKGSRRSVYNNAGNGGMAQGKKGDEDFNQYQQQQQQQSLASPPSDRGFQDYGNQMSQNGSQAGGMIPQQQQQIMNQQEIPMPALGGSASAVGSAAGAAAAGGGAAAAYAAAAAAAGPNEEPMEAVFNYVPNLSDEIYLYVGDPVIVKCNFDDGWGYGYNMTTKQEGAFPMACVAPFGSNPQGRGESMFLEQEPQGGASQDPNRSSFSIRQRQSSMFGPPPGFRETVYTEAGPDFAQGR
ncbi:hypothetical protein HDU97_000683 [Phlyctochytrium planicorne]|nr:hypothetical protein HDU97_000683 [Phlyctochytrium planicorne]